MPTNLGRPFSTEWRGQPPHMLREDVPVWYRFLKKWGFLFEKLYYDCLVGGPYLSEKDKKDYMKRMWRANNAKRIDAVAEIKNEVWLIEVADGPGMRAIGQLLAYRSLWIEDPKINKIEKTVLVCRHIDKDLFSAMAQMGSLIYVMPKPNEDIAPTWTTPG